MGRILTYSLILLALVSCGAGRKTAVTDSKEPASVQMRVGSYNLWRPGPRDDGYAWDVRKFRLAKTIAEIGFDVFGVQEFDTVIQNDLPGLVEKEAATMNGSYSALTTRKGEPVRRRRESSIARIVSRCWRATISGCLRLRM